MLPDLKKIREAVKCHVAGLPIPYRTTNEHPAFLNLPDNNGCSCPAPHGRTFPIALDPLYCNRYEIREFAKEAYDFWVNYLGVCCGASPMLIREVADAVGLTVPSSKYKEKWKTTLCMVQISVLLSICKNMGIKLNFSEYLISFFV